MNNHSLELSAFLDSHWTSRFTILDEINGTSGPPLFPFQWCQDVTLCSYAPSSLLWGEGEGDNPFILFCPRLSFELWPCVRVWYIPLNNRSTLKTIQANCKQNNDAHESQRTKVVMQSVNNHMKVHKQVNAIPFVFNNHWIFASIWRFINKSM